MNGLSRSVVLLTALACAASACGPTVDTDSSGESSMGTGEATSSGVTATTSSGGTTTATTSTGTSTTAGTTAGTFSTSSSGDDSASTGFGVCDCEGSPIEFNQMTDDGLSAADVIATFNGDAFPLYWHALQNQAPSMVTVELTYDGGAVVDEVGGCCGAFLCAPCPEGLTVDVSVRIISQDGILDETTTGQLGGAFETFDGRQATSERISAAAAGGTWPGQAFVDTGAPFDVQEIWVQAVRYPEDPDFDTLQIFGGNPDDTILIASSFEMPP